MVCPPVLNFTALSLFVTYYTLL